MKVERVAFPVMELALFAEMHDLTLLVAERAMDEWQRRRGLKRWYASFKYAEVEEGSGLLRSVSGDGDTEDEAIHSLAAQLPAGVLLIKNAGSVEGRREIRLPRLTYASNCQKQMVAP